MTTGALQRAIRRARQRAASVERCGMCAGPVGPEHRHVWDDQDGELMCACTPCSLLFERESAGGGRYQLVPTRGRRLSGLSADELGVPVGLVFFVKQRDGRVLGHYPSPLGTTESEIDAGAWQAVEARSPELAGLLPQVEAFLVWTGNLRGAGQQWVVPVDDCFRLVALIRRHWTGMSGGSAVWREIPRFFDDLGRRHGRPSGDD
ncbi:hypothetical protein C5N14_27585 [Micromonospora sp. MW-13]|uniref:DUF5947 family protein n=1 Tax=unclassified Micromonospora TaxID=2617518 RepID=UPI000E443CF0|nr:MULTISPECIES: DUF5947 family protein [unclassified Micromonospora]MCX4471484.1 DUF5947 family protein [Micromonospora sp. NBC_01655]RGC65668.1 hypothetical protein C5N14_27585 [Micromonospora sp. MW-13]